MSHWAEGNITVNNSNIHYHRTGTDDQSPLVLLHGMTDNGLCWIPVAKALETTYDIIMIDARGHGLSDGFKDDYPSDLMVSDVAGVIRGLGIEQPSILGHSMGAATAALFAAIYPELVRAVLLEDPPIHESVLKPAEKKETPPQESEQEEKQPRRPWNQWLYDLKALSLEERLEKGRRDNPQWSEDEFGPWAEAKDQFDLSLFTARMAPGPRLSSHDIIARITCPALLITGDAERGAIVPPRVAREIAELNPDFQVAHIAGAGHNIRRDQFAQYMSTITAFLKEV